MPDSSIIVSYVDAALELHGIALNPQQRLRVIDTFMNTATLATPLLECELPAETEPAFVFTP